MDTNPLFSEMMLQQRNHAQSLKVSDCSPWYVSASYWPATIYAAGWTQTNQLVIVTDYAFSLNSPTRENTILMVEKEFPFKDNITDHWLRLDFQEINEVINLFGIYTGDGILVSSSWELDIIYPWWPIGLVMVANLQEHSTNEKIGGCPIHEFNYDWFRCGFSPDGKHFVVLTSEYAKVFSQR